MFKGEIYPVEEHKFLPDGTLTELNFLSCKKIIFASHFCIQQPLRWEAVQPDVREQQEWGCPPRWGWGPPARLLGDTQPCQCPPGPDTQTNGLSKISKFSKISLFFNHWVKNLIPPVEALCDIE